MKKLFLQLLMIIFFATSAIALPVVGDVVKLYDGTWGTYGGGEFNVDVLFSGSEVDYISFCLERNETLNYGFPYLVYSVEDYAELGGLSGSTAGKDYLDDVTRYTYWNYTFMDTFGTKSDELANNVQEVIWHLEGELNVMTPTAQIFYDNYIFGLSYYSITGEVKVMNIGYYVYDIDKEQVFIHKQSQIVGSPVPEPATVSLLGIGLVMLSWQMRKKIN